MATLHIQKKADMERAETEARDLCTADSWADYSYTSVPFTPDNKPKLMERLRDVLARKGVTYLRLLWGCSSADCAIHDVLLAPTPEEGNHGAGLVICRRRIPLGD